MTGIILRHGEGYVRKIAKIRNLQKYKDSDHALMAHMNGGSQVSFERECDVYRRLLPHDGLVGNVKVRDKEIIMEYLPEDLEHHILENAEPPLATKTRWVTSMIETTVYIH